MKIPKFKSLLSKLSFLLLFPVFTILFLGGVVIFFYVRNVMLDQWNEAAILKLQRAAHDIEMRLSKPIELGGKRKEVAILISDIRGFTGMTETLSPEATIYILNRYFSNMIRVIQKHNGIIVDFIGDAILVFFEPLNGSFQGAVEKSLLCAAKMQIEMKIFNQELIKEGLPEFNIGIGINAGEVVVGNIGSKERSKYGIVGSAVNLTQRIQDKAQGKEIVVTDSVLAQLNNRVSISKTFQQKLKGIKLAINLHVPHRAIHTFNTTIRLIPFMGHRDWS